MGEISGMGGGYEEACQNMVRAGLEWLEKHPEAKIEFTQYKNIAGIVSGENKDTLALEDYMVEKGAKGDATGAMVQWTLNHVRGIHENGWDWYVKKLEDREKKEKSA